MIVDSMIADEAVRQALIERVLAAGLPDEPVAACVGLGRVVLGDGLDRGLFVRCAADAVLTDAGGNIVLIRRLHPPGAGMLAIPGGFLDVVDGRLEGVEEAARRELGEETGVSAAVIGQARLLGVGWRRHDRPFDLRVAWSDLAGTEIRRGDIFMVSTQPVYLLARVDLARESLRAGDDAAGACVMRVADLRREDFGVADQPGMLAEIPTAP